MISILIYNVWYVFIVHSLMNDNNIDDVIVFTVSLLSTEFLC